MGIASFGVMNRLIANIPRRQIIRAGRRLGMLLYVLDISHRRLVQRNLQFCYEDWSPEQIQRLSKRVFRNAGITLLELCQFPFMAQDHLLAMFRVQNEEIVTEALGHNRGAIIISAHMGNWEMALQFASCRAASPFTVVAQRMRNPWVDRLADRLRTRFGINVVYKKGALPEMIQALRRGHMLGLMIDQSRRKQGVDVSFFGRQATATPAAALVAMRCKSPVLPVFSFRDADGQLTIRVMPPLSLQRTKDLRSDLRANTQIMIRAVEEIVREHPEDWFWILRPWKKAYPNLYPEWEKRRQRRKARRKKRQVPDRKAL